MTIEMAMSMMSDEMIERFENETGMTLEEYLNLINSNPMLRIIADLTFNALLEGD